MIGKNPITGDPLLIAPERASRPNAWREGIDRCPFCPGHEADTPAETWRDGDPWSIRVFPNKYPATGQHEVMVETPDHGATFDRLAPAHAERAVASYITQYYSILRHSASVCIFKNHGLLAGASIPHMHSQILGTPFVPPRIARESAAFAAAARCPLCDLGAEPLIASTDYYRWIAPRGAAMAYESWIVPARHEPEFREDNGLASLLQRATRGMLAVADSFNWIFLNFPRRPAAHWYVQLFPRLSMHAGFEFGSGSAINTVEAQTAARRLAGEAR